MTAESEETESLPYLNHLSFLLSPDRSFDKA
jgi:hypothetical protein